MTAAIRSTVPDFLSGRALLSRSNREAAALVKRSSHNLTGSPVKRSSIAAYSFTHSACGPTAPLMFSGYPTRIISTARSRMICANADKSARLFRVSKVSSPCAVTPSSSLTAMPMRRFPKSRAKIRNFPV